jgi:hypothetical protein
VNYAKLLEMDYFFTLHGFLEVGKTHDLPSKFWQTLEDALSYQPAVFFFQDTSASAMSNSRIFLMK